MSSLRAPSIVAECPLGTAPTPHAAGRAINAQAQTWFHLQPAALSQAGRGCCKCPRVK
jgi:hypothetical protein